MLTVGNMKIWHEEYIMDKNFTIRSVQHYWLCMRDHMRHYNSRTKRRRDLQFGPFCSYCYRQDDLYFRFDILPTQTEIFYDVW